MCTAALAVFPYVLLVFELTTQQTKNHECCAFSRINFIIVRFSVLMRCFLPCVQRRYQYLSLIFLSPSPSPPPSLSLLTGSLRVNCEYVFGKEEEAAQARSACMCFSSLFPASEADVDEWQEEVGASVLLEPQKVMNT